MDRQKNKGISQMPQLQKDAPLTQNQRSAWGELPMLSSQLSGESTVGNCIKIQVTVQPGFISNKNK